jgi:DNA uptake protein ComE-like DNA-binding protein
MSTKTLKRCSFGIAGIFLLFLASPTLAEKWSQRYIASLPDSAFASMEITKDGKKIRHLPHHNHVGEVDISHLKSAFGRIHRVKWIDRANFAKAKDHLDQHYQVYKVERTKARGLKGPINIDQASINEPMQLPHIGGKIAMSIIEHRKTYGSFKTLLELRRVRGIGPKIYRDIEDLVIVEWIYPPLPGTDSAGSTL